MHVIQVTIAVVIGSWLSYYLFDMDVGVAIGQTTGAILVGCLSAILRD